MKFRYFVYIFLFLLACGSGDNDISSEVVIPVSVEEIQFKPIQQFISTTATVRAIKEVTLRSEGVGYYRLAKRPQTNIPLAMGNFVKQGQVIAYLDNPELKNNIKIESQKLNLDISKREFEKQRSLYDKGGVTLRELKNAERSYIDAQYNYDNAKIQLQKLKVSAPFNGILVDLTYYTEGTKVETNAEIAKIMDYSQLYAEVNLPHKEMSRTNTSQKVRVMNYSLPEDTLWGEVTQLAPAIDPTSRTFKATIIIDNHDLVMRPGMFVQIEIIVASKDSAIVIPKDIVMFRRGEKTVFVVEKGAAIQRTIATGLENRDQLEVVEGLKESERLIVKGFETLRNRSKVKIIR